MTITEFLLARIAEDEAANDWQVTAEVERRQADGMPGLTEAEVREYWGEQAWWKRRLAECEAKRGLLAFVLEHGATVDGEWGCSHDAESLVAGGSGPLYDGDDFRPLPSDCDGIRAALPGLLLLAAVYADHPDYDEAWRT